MSELIHKLENTVLDLGVELFALKSRLDRMTNQNRALVKSFKALRDILEEKNIITAEDFDLAIDMGRLDATATAADTESRRDVVADKKWAN